MDSKFSSGQAGHAWEQTSYCRVRSPTMQVSELKTSTVKGFHLVIHLEGLHMLGWPKTHHVAQVNRKLVILLLTLPSAVADPLLVYKRVLLWSRLHLALHPKKGLSSLRPALIRGQGIGSQVSQHWG